MNRVLFLAVVASAAAAGYFIADPPVNLQASSPGTQQIGNSNVSGTMLAGKVSATDSGATAQVIVGDATATVGANFGGLFKTASTTGTGIRGVATATTGGGNGGTFQTAGPTGAGVRGFSTAATGENYGVFGQTASPAGFAGFFQGRLKVTGDAVFGGILNGNGSGLSSLNAGNLVTGTVPNARLASDVALTTEANFFNLAQGFSAGTAATPAIGLFASGNGFFAPNGASIAVATGGLERMRVDSNGRLGIRNTTPDRLIHLISGSSAAAPVYSSNCDMVLEGNNNTGLQLIGDVRANLIFGTLSNTTGFHVTHFPATDGLMITSGISVVMQYLDGTTNRVGILKTTPTTALDVSGTITGQAKNFLIDDPRDPRNSTLRHACVESDEYKNVYDGIVITDSRGFATVVLPDWFDALNEKFRYQLTVIDGGEEFVLSKVVREVEDKRFIIRTSQPGVKVSWMVTGVRKDAYATDNPLKVEAAKAGSQRGKLLYERPETVQKPPR